MELKNVMGEKSWLEHCENTSYRCHSDPLSLDPEHGYDRNDMYEPHTHPPLSRRAFLRRLAGHFGIVAVLVLVSLAFGILGYMQLEGLAFPEAFLHSATLLGGLGIVEAPASTAAKFFAGLYALYSGLVFLAAFGIIVAPIMHRIVHKFHWDGAQSGGD